MQNAISGKGSNCRGYRAVKRTADILIALVGCTLLIPLTVVVFIANVISADKGPVFYVQKRIGKDGKPFCIYKYRSMVVDADRILKKYLAENKDAAKEYKKYKKLKNDPRITPVGSFLRKTSLDEFPQFINILLGNMSVVGPRPYLEREKNDMGESYNEIIKVKPGLTGPWQVSGRSDIPFDERLVLDVEYASNCSFKNDAKYFFGTFSKLFYDESAF